MLHPGRMRITVLASPYARSAVRSGPTGLLSLALGAALSACSSGSGDPGQEVREATGFDGIDVGGPFQVSIQVGGPHHVEIRGDDNLVPKVRSETVGSTLHLELPGRVVTKLPLEAIITLPALVDLDASGAASVTAAEVGGERLEVEASGASRVILTGARVEALDADVSGSSTLDAAGLTVGRAQVEASGASMVTVRVTDALHAEASGASTIRYHGSPAQVQRDESGASTVEPAS